MSKPNYLVLGHTGFLGNAVYQRLLSLEFNALGVSRRTGHDLRSIEVLNNILDENKIDIVINCAAHVGGISYGIENQDSIFHDNLMLATSLLESLKSRKVKLINPISNCAYPSKMTVYRESEFWDGPIDSSVLSYGLTRKALVVGTQAYSKTGNFRATNIALPNLYGPGDHLDPVRAHALGGLIYRAIRAKSENDPNLSIWGTGEPIREWLYIDDAVEAILRFSKIDDSFELVNFGSGEGVSVANLAKLIVEEVGFEGSLSFDKSKLDGAMVKTMEAEHGRTLIKYNPQTELKNGIAKTVSWYKSELSKLGIGDSHYN
jgi:GDP-L-fucose synthase